MNMFQELAVFDTETTGVNVETSRIVTAMIGVVSADGTITERYDWLINPGVDIPEQATAVHGVTNAIAQDSGMDAATGVAQIANKLAEISARGIPVVAYNASYDLSLLHYEVLRYGLPQLQLPELIIDPYVLDKAFDKYRRGKRKLENVAEHYGVSLTDAHDAGADAIAAGLIAFKISQIYADKLQEHNLMEFQRTQAAEQAASLQDYFNRQGIDTVVDGRWPVKV